MNRVALVLLSSCALLAACGGGGRVSSRSAQSPRASTESAAAAEPPAPSGTDSAIVRLGTPRVGGTMRPADVQSVVDDRNPQVRVCWRGLAWRLHGMRDVGVLGLAERVTMSWNIQPNGSITNLQRSGGTIEDRDFDRCVVEALQSLHFETTGTGSVVRVEVPYDLISD